ncbi:MAG: hypothetical protein WBA73_07240 [Devosia sp.]
MDKPSGFSVTIVSLVAIFLVALLAINKTFSGYMFSDMVLLSSFMAVVSGGVSGALWKKSTLADGDGHANRVAATAAIAATLYGAVAILGLATMADGHWVHHSQFGAFLAGTAFLAYAFRETVIAAALRRLWLR